MYDEGVAAGRGEGEAHGRSEGIAEGKAESILQVLEELGEISPEMREKILAQRDVEVLNKWIKGAVKVQTLEEFFEKIGE